MVVGILGAYIIGCPWLGLNENLSSCAGKLPIISLQGSNATLLAFLLFRDIVSTQQRQL